MRRWECLLPGLLFLLAGCGAENRPLHIGVAFETLQTEYWVASFEAVRAELNRRGIEMIEAVADNDANRQLEQIHTFIARRVDGILVAPKDATTVVPMIRAANEAGVPIVIYNRPPALLGGFAAARCGSGWKRRPGRSACDAPAFKTRR